MTRHLQSHGTKGALKARVSSGRLQAQESVKGPSNDTGSPSAVPLKKQKTVP